MGRPPLAMILPIMAALLIVIWGGGLGTIFILLNSTSAGVWGSIIIGMALVVGVPTIAALLAAPRR